MRIAVTGGTGFLGTPLTRTLESLGHQVRVVSRSRGYDVRSLPHMREACSGREIVYHLAAVVQSRSEAFVDTNVEGLKNVLRASRDAGVRRLIYVSSFTIFGPSQEGDHREEDVPLNRRHFFHDYDRTKYAGFQIARRWKGRLSLNMVFPTVVFGPGPLTEGNLMVRLFRRWLRTRLVILPEQGTPVWNFVYVQDVVTALARLLDVSSDRDFILGGQNCSLLDLSRMAEEISGRRLFQIKPGPRLFHLGCFFEDWASRLFSFPPLIVPQTSEFLRCDWRFSSESASQVLDYSPRPLRQGLTETLAWLKKETNV